MRRSWRRDWPAGDAAAKLYDVFRDRAMFAIRTADGRIAGFIGRLPDGGTGPKYLNSPDSAFFHKGDLLYGLHEARERFAGGARPVLVEGPLDAIAVGLAAAPREHAAVAACGLSLTAAQLAALGRAADLDRTGLVLALDGDPAGRTAALRAWETLAPVGGPVEAVPFPTGRDPADLLREEGPGAVRRALSGTAGLMDLVVDGAVERSGGTLGTPEQRLAAIRAAAAVIAAGRPAEAAAQVVRVAARLGVDAGCRHRRPRRRRQPGRPALTPSGGGSGCDAFRRGEQEVFGSGPGDELDADREAARRPGRDAQRGQPQRVPRARQAHQGLAAAGRTGCRGSRSAPR